MVDEDLEPLITRCPNCVTQFRVTESQLAAASGRVRCGACLTVFQGIDHLILDEDATFTSGREADAALDALLDELGSEDPASVVEEVAELQDNPAVTDGDSALETLPMETFEPSRQLYGGFEDDSEEDSGPDQTVASDQEVAPGPDVSLMPLPDAADLEALDETQRSELGASRDPQADPVPAEVERSEQGGPEGDYEKWLAPAPENIEQLVEEIVASGRPAADHLQRADEADRADATEASIADQTGATATAEASAAGTGFHLSAVENALEQEGVGVRPILFAPEPRRWWVGGVAALLTVVLGVQYFYLQLPEWSLDPGLRGSYVSFCNVFGCELPEMRSVESLRTRNLVVRSHPDLQRTLIIDAVIVSQARYPQRFPDLALKFTAVDGALVAGRLFTPEEYLGGEMREDDLMPSSTPVQISLEIDDPGKEAVNYTLSFH